MKIKKNISIVPVLAGALLISALTGCGVRDPQDVRSVEWYEKNASERAETLGECRANPDTFDQTPDCVNAGRAENNVTAGASQRDAEGSGL